MSADEKADADWEHEVRQLLVALPMRRLSRQGAQTATRNLRFLAPNKLGRKKTSPDAEDYSSQVGQILAKPRIVPAIVIKLNSREMRIIY